MNYTGDKCKLCGQDFHENDDIVVCPDCGTPYHRECYKKTGKCINFELHVKKTSWKSEKSETTSDNKSKVCTRCGYKNKNSSSFCENCGNSLHSDKEKHSENSGFSNFNAAEFNEQMNQQLKSEICEKTGITDEEIDGVKLYEMAYFVKTNIFYYISAFKKFVTTGKKLSINLLCFLVPYYYFSNRKMYFWSFISFLIITLLSVPQYIEIISSGLIKNINVDFINTGIFNAVLNLSNFLIIVFRVIISFFANWLYSKHIIKSIKNIKQTCPQSQWNINMMRQGGTSFAAIIITLLIELAVVLTLMSVISTLIYTLQIYFN